MPADSSSARVHIVGAGIAGLACAVRLAGQGRPVSLYEAAAQAGGRCRSYLDAKLDRRIDNGNHILLTANREALSYLEEIGARDALVGPERAAFPFVDLASGQRWTLRPNPGRLPWWIASAARRVPDTSFSDYLAGLRLAQARPEQRVVDLIPPGTALFERFWRPLTVAALNTAPEEASAKLLWLVVRETFFKGEEACRPLIAREGLGEAFVAPALARLEAAGAELRFQQRLRALEQADGRVGALDFGETRIALQPGESVVLAVTPAVAADLLPGLTVPDDSRPIVNAHIVLPRGDLLPRDLPFLGLVGGSTDWIFVRGDVASLTVSAAEDLAEEPNEVVAAKLWRDTARALGLEESLAPPIRIIKEKRATLAQTPQALLRRPPAGTALANLFLAGDWTDTGYPATIESAVRSGRAAAALAGGRG